mmetsp:Transcript_12555/g.37062  ORF Transcript_12555/g.37062 Transcript_12555/m.37062 type:complete len:99 (+) Transcript_12555:740-1036(+)
MVRVLWYLIHVAASDPPSRRRGMIYVMNNRGMTWRQYDSALYRGMVAIPIKYMTAPGAGRFTTAIRRTCFTISLFPRSSSSWGERMRKEIRGSIRGRP